MKLTSLFGLLMGLGLVFVAIISRGSLLQFISIESIFIVLGGTVGATLLSFNRDQLEIAIRAIRVVFFDTTPPPDNLIPIMVDLVKQARVNGVGSLEVPEGEGERNEFLHKAVDMLIDGIEPSVAAQILQGESDAIASRYRMSERLFTVMGTYTPLFGLLGTVIGLIIMLSSVNDPMAIPGAMAVAMLTTFYGVLFSAMIFRPMATKIRAWNYDEIQLRDLIIETMMHISEGVNSQISQERLQSQYRTRRRG